MKNQIETIDCIRIDIKTLTQKKEVVATESKLALYVNDEFVYEFLYSHGFDDYLVYGYLLSSGLITNIEDIASFEIQGRECKVVLLEERVPRSQPVDRQEYVSFDKMLQIRNLLVKAQTNHQTTRGFHGAILYELSSNRSIVCEDIGRHNAVDKVIGYALRERYMLSDAVLLISGRLLSNIVSKGVHAEIPVIASMTVATLEGIQEGKDSDHTLIGSLSDKGCWLYHEGSVKVKTAIQ
ncbi:MAG: formate dehydrogenase accessory sulfurtransferase FdhD [Candidatus Thorarchaeota archaeon]